MIVSNTVKRYLRARVSKFVTAGRGQDAQGGQGYDRSNPTTGGDFRRAKGEDAWRARGSADESLVEEEPHAQLKVRYPRAMRMALIVVKRRLRYDQLRERSCRADADPSSA